MNKFKIAIVEDNVYEQEMLKDCLAEVVKGNEPVWYRSGEEFIEADKRYDIVFLDYEMPGMNGIETAEVYRKKWPKAAVVFASGHEEILPQGYKVHAYDFLVKPIQKAELQELISRILEEREYQALHLEYDGKKYNVPVNHIVYFEAGKHGNGVVIRTTERVYKDSQQLSYYEEMLSAECFVRVHRSYIVNLFYVVDYGKGEILLRNNERALLSSRRKKNFEEKLNEFKWKKGRL